MKKSEAMAMVEEATLTTGWFRLQGRDVRGDRYVFAVKMDRVRSIEASGDDEGDWEVRFYYDSGTVDEVS